MLQSLIGKKLGQTSGFLENGNRIPMTRIWVKGNVVSQIKTTENDGYEAIQLGFLTTNKANKPLQGHAKKSGLKETPRFYRETKVEKIEDHELGVEVNPEEVVSAGDIIDITGVSKGKGFAGVVKRHHFRGGPKTHGQSDRHRAPGSIGQSTTPGRVYKGKKMAGRMGNAQVTVKNLEVIDLKDGELLVKGLIPGPIGSIVTITRIGENKKHMGLYQEPVAEEEIVEAKVKEIGESIEEQEEQRKETEAKAEAEEKAEKEAARGLNNEETASAVEKATEASEGKKEEAVEAAAEEVKAEDKDLEEKEEVKAESKTEEENVKVEEKSKEESK